MPKFDVKYRHTDGYTYQSRIRAKNKEEARRKLKRTVLRDSKKERSEKPGKEKGRSLGSMWE